MEQANQAHSNNSSLVCRFCGFIHSYYIYPNDQSEIFLCKKEKELLAEFKRIADEEKESIKKTKEALNGVIRKFWDNQEIKTLAYDARQSLEN